MIFFDPRTVERESEPVVVDAGTYLVAIDGAKKKESMSGMGCFVFFKILSPALHKNAVVMNYFNLEHDNAEAKRIGRLEFAKMLDCMGMGETILEYPENLIGRRLKIEVEICPSHKDPTKAQNRIKKCLPLNSIDQNLLDNPLSRVSESPF